MLLTPLALVAFQIASAFPVRGSLWRSLDSSVVIDGDTVVVGWAGLASLCGGHIYQVDARNEETARLRRFRTTGPSFSYLVSVSSKQLGMSGSMAQCATPTTSLAPTDQRQFLLRGKTHLWALWADTIAEDAKIPATQVHGRFKARWRWSLVDSTLPWVRWIDTLYLGSLEVAPGSKPSLHSQPLLTTLRSTSLDSIVAGGTSCGSGLFLGSDTLGLREWGSSGPECAYCYCSGAPVFKPLVPTAPIPAARTFRPVLAYNSGTQAKWILRHEGKKVDSLWMHGTASASVFRPEASLLRRAPGTHAIEPATGRRFPLDKPLPTGVHLLAGPGGPRLVVVE